METLGEAGAKTSRTNLIVHHGVTDILGQAAKLIDVLGAIQEPRDLASLCQWDEFSENLIELPNRPCVSV